MKSKKVNWGHVIVFIILILCMIVTLLPFVWMILTSLKTQAESICIPLKIFPENRYSQIMRQCLQRFHLQKCI